MEWHLETQALTKDFGGLRAVNELSFGIRRSEIVGLIGPNGSGKSTTINVVAGFYKPSSGQVLFRGEPIQGMAPWKIANLGILRTFQQTKSFEYQTVLGNVMFGCHLHERSGVLDSAFRRGFVNSETKDTEAKAMEILERTGLSEYAVRPVGSLPPGAQRVLAIAMCLAADPSVLLLDEPACGLSFEESNQLMGLVRQLKDQGLSILVIDHHMKVIMNLCDRIVVIDHGTKIAEGSPAEIASNDQVIEAYLGHQKMT